MNLSLYAEAVNEKGLAMAGLNFPGNAFYQEPDEKGLELASFEIIAWILGKCASVEEAEGIPYRHEDRKPFFCAPDACGSSSLDAG